MSDSRNVLSPLRSLPPIVTESEWKHAREALLAKEKAYTRAGDVLAAERRRMPMVAVTSKYTFSSADGDRDLDGLFEGRRQLILYNHMLKPADTAPCPGCCMFTDMVGHLAHLNARDTTFALVSRAPTSEIEVFKKRMGWEIPWYSNTDKFSTDVCEVGSFALNIFLQDSGNIYHTYVTTGRGVEHLGSVWTFLDLTPLGRQENWEDSPAGWPQTEPYHWWRLHDEYNLKNNTGCCS